MPQIAQYEAPALGLRPSETGVQATAAAARRLQGDYSEAAAAIESTGKRFGSDIALAGDVAVKYIDHQQISHGANALAGLTAKKTQEWNDTAKNADPNDPTVAKKFLEENLEPELEKFKTGFLTENSQKWAEAHVEQLRTHMYAKTSADMATMAGEAAKINHRQTVNGLASTAYNDPSSLDFALKTLESAAGAVIDSSPNLTGTAAARIKIDLLQSGKEAIIKAAVAGMIEQNPYVNLDDIQKKYGEYITGQEMKTFAKAAQQHAKAALLTEKQTEVYQRQLNKRAIDAEQTAIIGRNVTFDPGTNRATINPNFFREALDLAKRPDATPQDITTLLNWGQHQQGLKDGIKSNPGVKQDLVDRMFDTDNPTTELDLMRAQMKEDLSKDDFATLHHTVKLLEESPLKGPIWKDTMDAVKANLIVAIPGLPGKDTRGVGNYAKFAQLFIPQYLAAVRAGNVPANALDVNDPKSMISQAMAPFTRTQAERLRDYVAIARGLKLYGEDDTPAETPLPNATTPTPKKNEIPPATRREVNKVYQTDVGPRKWTGTGWVQP